jgi:hypothetical protein
VDTAGIDMEPIRNNNIFWVYIFIAFMVMGNFMCVNFFVGAICDNVSTCGFDALAPVFFMAPLISIDLCTK